MNGRDRKKKFDALIVTWLDILEMLSHRDQIVESQADQEIAISMFESTDALTDFYTHSETQWSVTDGTNTLH